MKTSSITRSRKLPKFIKTHKIFTKFDNIEKIFPLIGLENCSERVKEVAASLDAAKTLRTYLIKCFSNDTYYFYNRAGATQIANQLRGCKPSEFIQDGQLIPVPTKLAKEIPNINTAYKKHKYNPEYHDYYSGPDYNIYSSKNYQLPKNPKIVFSSDDKDGLWDIATMSMRGFTSCQSWGGSYKRNLIGSMVDPFLGIIYLTDGTQLTKGTKMCKRALVRYVINRQTGRPALFLEKVYPNGGYYDRSSQLANQTITDLFRNFLKKKTNNRIPVVTSAHGYSIPNSKIVKAMSSCGEFTDASDYCRSYRDSGIGYSKKSRVNFAKIKAF